MLCNEVNTTFSGRSLCSISNSAVLCTALLKAACCQPEQSPVDVSRSPSQRPQRPGLSPGVGGGLFASPRSNGSTARTHSRKSSSGGGVGVGVDGVDGVGSRNVLGRSKPIPIKRQRSKRDRESMTSQGFFPNSTCGVGSASYTSPAFFPQSWSIISSNGRDRLGSGGKVSRHQTPRSYRSWVILNDSELESGYEADVERGTHNIEIAESCGEMEDRELKEGELLRSLTSYLVPTEVKQRVWIVLPIQYCIDILSENVNRGLSPQGLVVIKFL